MCVAFVPFLIDMHNLTMCGFIFRAMATPPKKAKLAGGFSDFVSGIQDQRKRVSLPSQIELRPKNFRRERSNLNF